MDENIVNPVKENLQKEINTTSELFPLEKVPDEKCPFCMGTGATGYFYNSKIIPCRCTFLTNDGWFTFYHYQMSLAKVSKDQVVIALGKNHIKEK